MEEEAQIRKKIEGFTKLMENYTFKVHYTHVSEKRMANTIRDKW
ncbi:hypothetical protein AusDCA_1277 [Desulfitobacterium sp. AusDCA]